MAGDIETRLSTRDGEQQWVREIHGLVRGLQFEAAESRLVAVLSRQQHVIAREALAMSLDRLSVRSWDRLNRFLSRPVHRLERPAVALALELSNYGEALSGEPGTEAWVYCDRPGAAFHFATATREEFLAASADRPAPWEGAFDGGTDVLLVGFAPLNSLLVEYRRGGADRKRGTDGYASFVAASLLQGLRFHQLVVTALAEHGLSRRVPVLVAGHAEIYVASSVYWPERIVAADTRTEAEVERERRRGRVASPEMVEAGLRHLLGSKRGPLIDAGVAMLAEFLVESSRQRKQRRQAQRSASGQSE